MKTMPHTWLLCVVAGACAAGTSFGIGAVVEARQRSTIDVLRDVANVQAAELATIAKRCDIDRLTGAATCPPGTFATVRPPATRR